jgi:hypothetical protein
MSSLFSRLKVALAVCGALLAICAHAHDPKSAVVVNDFNLFGADLAALEQAVGARIPAGNYWYDGHSGAWGWVGKPTAGFTRSGMMLGRLRADASKGNSGVFLNGRELPKEDIKAFRRIGFSPRKTRYWLDEHGNCGLEHGGFLLNLVECARVSGYAGDRMPSTPLGYAPGDGSACFYFDPRKGSSIVIEG